MYAEIEQRIREEAQFELQVHDVEWFSTYKVHSRHVSQFSLGRCFLAGDAAHVHTPVGAQGMNTGIQDGYNLAWKLAFVLHGKADETILQTYNQERLENAKHLLQTTDRMPYFQVEGQSIYDKLRQPKFHLLTFSNTPGDAHVLKTELEHQNSKIIDFHLIPLDRQVATIFGTNQAFSVLLRPDNYIALLATEPSLHRVDHYLKELTQESLLRVPHHEALQA